MNEDNMISLEKIKAVLSLVSMALLTIQHFSCMFIGTVQISYLPLLVTFFTYFINSISIKDMKYIKYVSLIGTIIMFISGIIIYTFSNYNIYIEVELMKIYRKIMYAVLGVISMLLSILYVKRITEL